MNVEIILASTSIYRRELLSRLLPEFHCVAPGVDEHRFHSQGMSPDETAVRLAYEKSRAVAVRFPDAIVIGSDQLVDLDQQILGKPGSESSAVMQLLSMSGRTHRLLTAVCILSPRKQVQFVNTTTLTMRSLLTAEAECYVRRDQPLDCAGSYRIESLGISLFEKIETADFTAIMGLPLMQLSLVLRDFGVEIPGTCSCP
jgi:septum formation protein